MFRAQRRRDRWQCRPPGEINRDWAGAEAVQVSVTAAALEAVPSGEGSGAKTSGTGPGSNETANKGISPFPGTGGAGKGGSAPSAMPGVSVSGGSNNTITLPSFGPDGKSPGDSAHSSALKNQQGPGITVVATSRSGGAFNYYGALKGDKVYTIYIDTVLGTAVMQFADPKSATQSYPRI